MPDNSYTENTKKSKPLLSQSMKLKLRGFHVVPIAEGTKAPVGVIGWQTSDYTVEELHEFASRAGSIRYSGVGILLGYPTNNGKSIYAIDVDCMDEAVAADIATELKAWCGEKYLYRVGNKPKFAVPVLMDDSKLRKRKTKEHFKNDVKCLVEVLSFGQQIVCYSDHPDTNQPYTWHDGELADVDLEMLPVLTTEQVTAVLDKCKEVFARHGYAPNGDEEEERVSNGIARRKSPMSTFNIEDAALLLPLVAHHYPDYVEDHDMWIKVGMALHHQFCGSHEAFALWDTWSSKSSKYDQNDCSKRWASFHADAVGAFTIKSLLMLPDIQTWWLARTYKFGNVANDNFNNRTILTDDDRLEDELTARFAFFPNADRFYDTMTELTYSRQSLNGRWTRPPLVDPDTGRTTPRIRASALLEKSAKLEVLAGLAWHPTLDKIISLDGIRYFNTFKPWGASAVKGDVTAWLTVACHVWGEHADLVLDWMAFSLQYPETKIKWQILVHGAPRTGKTLAAKPWLRLFGNAGREVSQDMITAGWGDIYMRKKALTFEEVWFPGGKAFFNSLKSKLVNDDIEPINVKGQSVQYQQNLYSIYMCSNHKDALMFAEDDDKLLVIHAPNQRLDDRDYAILAEQSVHKDTPLMRAVYEYLMSRDVESFSYGKLPVRTKAAIDMSKASAPEWEEDLEDLSSSGTAPFDKAIVTVGEVRDYLKEKRYFYSPSRVEDVLVSLGYTKCRGKKKVDSATKVTPRFYTDRDVAGLSEPDLYSFYVANLSKRKFEA